MENKNQPTDISVIIPVHEFNDTTKTSFAEAIKSIEGQIVKPDEVVIVAPKNTDTIEYIKSHEYGSIKELVKIVENEGSTDFQTQFNLGVKNAKSAWVSLLEFDDVYAGIWFKNVIEYRKAYPEFEMFLPIVIDVDTNFNFLSLMNEALWAQQFSDKLGVLDNNAIQMYPNFSIDGAVIKKSVIEEFGGLKTNVKLTFIYEFFLRLTYKAVNIMTIPRFGYRHTNHRSESLFDNYKKTLDPVESKFWYAQAKKESYFQNDRKITYEAKND